MEQENLIFDVGMSEGNDTAYYLAKGFNVVGVEADPIMFQSIASRFKSEVLNGTLKVFNRVAAANSLTQVEFWRNDTHQGLSSLLKDGQAAEGGVQTRFVVDTIGWEELTSEFGVPYYAKVDIEGSEESFLSSMMRSSGRPPYISVEAHSFKPIESLVALGYKKFKLVNQNLLSGFDIPHPPLEGGYIANPNWSHASGPFGKELPGDWLTVDALTKVYEAVDFLRSYRTVQHTWFDCHAAL